MSQYLHDKPLAVVTGANRGIGFETCRQLAKFGIQTILTSRDESKGRKATETLSREGIELTYHQLDVADLGSISILKSYVMDRYQRCDILVNNAGVFLDRGMSILEVPLDTLKKTIETNFLGALNMCRAFIPIMRDQNYGRIVNVSSAMGSITRMGGYSSAYKLSKLLMNGMTRISADELRGTNIKINTMAPGWVRSDMGGPSAPRSLSQGADTIIWLATLPDDGPTGGFFENRNPTAW
ncbi:MAG: SDR family oxidoreductase [Chloroflexota bacterium]|nr:MAG: SDR family oxidoreductase [Chloroflexota bacterium]